MQNFPLRLQEDFKQELKIIAKKEKRSLNNLIEIVLEDFMDNYKANERKNQKRVSVAIEDL